MSKPKKTDTASHAGHRLPKRMDNRIQVPPNKVPASSPIPVRASPTNQAFRED